QDRVRASAATSRRRARCSRTAAVVRVQPSTTAASLTVNSSQPTRRRISWSGSDRPARAARTSTSPTSAPASTDGGSTRCPRSGTGTGSGAARRLLASSRRATPYSHGRLCAGTSVRRRQATMNASSRHTSYRPDGPLCPAPISVLSRTGVSGETARSRATHLAGSWYSTRVSLRLLTARIGGYGLDETFSYGEYDFMYAYTRGSS